MTGPRAIAAAILLTLAADAAPAQTVAPDAAAAGRSTTGTESLRLRNRSGVDLVRVFASPVSDAYWRDDLLGDYVLGSGRDLSIGLSNVSGCLYDLLLLFADGAVVPDRVDVCAAESYTVRP